jgi:hypothetical protein
VWLTTFIRLFSSARHSTKCGPPRAAWDTHALVRLRYALAGLTLMLSCRPVAVSVGDGVGVGVAVERAAAGLTIYPRVGDAGDAQPALAGPALILMGGGSDVDDAFRWAQTVIGEGDVVVLRASGGDGYDAYLAGLAPFHSVQTVKLEPPASADALAQAAAIVERAELVFFAGGDQADYVAWRGSPLLAAVQGVWARGGVVGGTSAGCAILGQLVFDDVAAALANVNVDGLRALADPWDGAISFSRDLFAFAPMAGVITPHRRRRRRPPTPRRRCRRPSMLRRRAHRPAAPSPASDRRAPIVARRSSMFDRPRRKIGLRVLVRGDFLIDRTRSRRKSIDIV